MIAPGLKVLLVSAEGRKHLVKTGKGMIEIHGLGVIDGDALCKASFGDAITIGAQKFTIIRPSVKDLLGMIERRAQVMIPKDSFFVPLHLDISCGSKVIEGGVGSGALTIVLLKSVAPSGKVISYELRKDHADLARRNVAMTGLEDSWELRLEDVCSADLEKGADAAVIDIPNPWDAVDNVKKSLKVGGYFCCYVPNANQLADAVKKMREAGFLEIVSFETIQREMVVHEGGVRPSFDSLGHTGYLTFGRKMAPDQGN
jgi:tRNA (adenine57-N1/adenine58-N1)-methyltransferase catalytic subunit